MSKAGRIRNNGIRHEGVRLQRGITGQVDAFSGLEAGPPTPADHCADLLPPAADCAVQQRVHLGDQLRVLHHKRHELGGIAADVEELQAMLPHKVAEHQMGRESHAMAVSLQRLADCNERLNVASGSDDVNHYVHAKGEVDRGFLVGRRAHFLGWLVFQRLNELRRPGDILADVDV